MKPTHKLMYGRITACGKYVPEKTDVLLTQEDDAITCKSCFRRITQGATSDAAERS